MSLTPRASTRMTSAARRQSAGFVLMEALLAVAIFSIVGIGLAVTLSRAFEAVVAMGREDEIISGLESRLATMRVDTIAPMKEVEEASTSGIVFTREIVEAELENMDGDPVEGLYILRVTATRSLPRSDDEVFEVEVYARGNSIDG